MEASTVNAPHVFDGEQEQEFEGTSVAEEVDFVATATLVKGNNPDRPYVVFQKVPLTVAVLEQLLVEASNPDNEPEIAYLELETVVAKTVNSAIEQAYKSHAEELGAVCDLATASVKSFSVRHVAPKEIRETRISIS